MSIKSAFSGTSPSGEKFTPIGNISAIGGIIGIIAAVVGLVLSLGWSLLPIPSIHPSLYTNANYTFASGIFMALLTVGILFQAIGSRNFRNYVGSSLASVSWLVFLIGLIIAVSILTGPIPLRDFYAEPTGSATPVALATSYVGYVTNLMTLMAFFTIFWQAFNIIYVDTSKNWIGFIASMCNGLFIPLLATAHALGPVFALTLTYLAYILLLIGQLFTFLFWRSPFDNIREYARSPEKAKFAFGMTGLLTFVMGLVAVFVGAFDELTDVPLW